jgi:hypothetical protein
MMRRNIWKHGQADEFREVSETAEVPNCRYQIVGTVPVHSYEQQCCAFYIVTNHIAETRIILSRLALRSCFF